MKSPEKPTGWPFNTKDVQDRMTKLILGEAKKIARKEAAKAARKRA